MNEKFNVNVPLELVDAGERFYGSAIEGIGRWATLPALGVLRTDDDNGLRLGFLDGADDDAANELRRLLVAYATEGWTATEAFDDVIADNGSPAVHAGVLNLG